MSDRYDPASRGFDDIAYRRLTPRVAKTSLPEPTSHERDTLRRRVEDMAAENRHLKNVLNLRDLGEGLLGASSKTLEGNPDEADRHKARIMRDAVDGMYAAFAPPGTRDVAKAEESLFLDMQSHEVEAYINRRLRAQPSKEPTGTMRAATTGGGGGNRFGMQPASMMGGGAFSNTIIGGVCVGGSNRFGAQTDTSRLQGTSSDGNNIDAAGSIGNVRGHEPGNHSSTLENSFESPTTSFLSDIGEAIREHKRNLEWNPLLQAKINPFVETKFEEVEAMGMQAALLNSFGSGFGARTKYKFTKKIDRNAYTSRKYFDDHMTIRSRLYVYRYHQLDHIVKDEVFGDEELLAKYGYEKERLAKLQTECQSWATKAALHVVLRSVERGGGFTRWLLSHDLHRKRFWSDYYEPMALSVDRDFFHWQAQAVNFDVIHGITDDVTRAWCHKNKIVVLELLEATWHLEPTDGGDSPCGLSEAQQRLSDAISRLPSPAAFRDDAYRPGQYVGLDQVISTLQGATHDVRQRHKARVARDRAVIEDTAIRIGDGSRVEARMSALESLVETLQEQHNSHVQKVFELEGEVSSKNEDLREKQDEISAKDNQINDTAERIESLQDRLRRRSSSP
ncbi:hypothetical protein KC347_g2991 [Hortaea werneckii]|nr:hypothetical protein KC347_g2991 [Hortaea werneckii]